jgi:hypothetical protein
MAQYIGKQEKKTKEQRKQGKTEEWLKTQHQQLHVCSATSYHSID